MAETTEITKTINCYRFQDGKYLNCAAQKKPFCNVFLFLRESPGYFILDGNWADIVTNRLFFVPPDVEFSITCEGAVDCFHISFDSPEHIPVHGPYFTIVTPEFRAEFVQKAIELAGSCLVLDNTLATQHLEAILKKLGHLTSESYISFATRHVAVRVNDIPRHFHFDEYQIDYFASGSGTIFIGNRWVEYTDGTFSFVPPQIPHEIIFPRSSDIDEYSIKFKFPGNLATGLPREAFVRQVSAGIQPTALALLKKIVGEFVMDIPVSFNRLTSLLAVISQIANPSFSGKRNVLADNTEDCFVTRVKNIVLAHYSQELRITEVAHQMGLSAEYLSRQFKKLTRQTLVSYINTQRLKLGMTMLQNTNMPIKQIAANCGFKNVNYFTTIFKRFFSVTPKDVQKRGKAAVLR
jgi:AraC-like DNA-binding protein/mannose-6-phosphate isomerase-like protein (cupin superfamily)